MHESNQNSSVPLYVIDSDLKEFDAIVVKTGPKFVILNRTAFYPESGGQPSDTGKYISMTRKHLSAKL